MRFSQTPLNLFLNEVICYTSSFKLLTRDSAVVMVTFSGQLDFCSGVVQFYNFCVHWNIIKCL